MKANLKISTKETISVEALRGNRSLHPGLRGEIHPDLRGEIHPGLRGNLSDLRGDLSGLWGNLDECEISDEERKAGIDIEKLVAP